MIIISVVVAVCYHLQGNPKRHYEYMMVIGPSDMSPAAPPPPKKNNYIN